MNEDELSDPTAALYARLTRQVRQQHCTHAALEYVDAHSSRCLHCGAILSAFTPYTPMPAEREA